ncbi:ABC-2 transporter permease [Microbacterium sp. TNHR37B]|uniref:ABC-2 transporter permease n=1 Tax=Microbacterium sp. TNHR37B TaxID=1775956 RepID=UPI0007B2BB30|nr:ABC-2 transporter permease [Microbacterium sp. TNHR37B]KZE91211.1 hypothetical protein AVP41_00748 [Microbacterium sp. TNHR37B]
MNSVVQFIRLDLRSLRPSARSLLLPALVLLVAAALPSQSPYAVIPAAGVFAVMIAPQYLFGNDERGRLDTLYGALGIDRRRVVSGRYATALAILVAMTAVGLLIAPLAAKALATGFDFPLALGIAAGSLAVAAVVLSIELPLYFAVGATRARTVGFAVPAAIVVVVVLVGGLVPEAGEAVAAALTSVPPVWLAVSALVVVLGLGIASRAVAARLYARRDL